MLPPASVVQHAAAASITCALPSTASGPTAILTSPNLHPPSPAGHLLEIASVITGLGIIIHEAVIKSCGACTDATGEAPLPAMPSEPQAGGQQPSSAAPADAQHDFSQGRLFRLWVSDSKGGKLDLQRISALLYTLELVMGRGHQPTVAPNIGMFVPGASAK
jgi:hypothetical protein